MNIVLEELSCAGLYLEKIGTYDSENIVGVSRPFPRKGMQMLRSVLVSHSSLMIGSWCTRKVSGGLEINLFRGGQEIEVHIDSDGSFFMMSSDAETRGRGKSIYAPSFNRTLTAKIEEMIGRPGGKNVVTPSLRYVDRPCEMRSLFVEVALEKPTEGFRSILLPRLEEITACKTLVVRDGYSPSIQSVQPLCDIPYDVFEDQSILEDLRLRDLFKMTDVVASHQVSA